MVPNLVTGVWVGGEDRSIHFKEIAFGQGASMALPIWGVYMKSLYEIPELEISKEDFIVPKNLSISVDCGEFDEEFKLIKSKPKADLKALGF